MDNNSTQHSFLSVLCVRVCICMPSCVFEACVCMLVETGQVDMEYLPLCLSVLFLDSVSEPWVHGFDDTSSKHLIN